MCACACGSEAALAVPELAVGPPVQPGAGTGQDRFLLAGPEQSWHKKAGTFINPNKAGINECVF